MSHGSEPARFAWRHPAGESTVVCGVGALRAALPALAEWVAGRALFFLSTPRVRGLHLESVAELRRSAARVIDLDVPEGEAAKSLEWAERLWREMVVAGGRRDSRMICFGGGSVGDLGGFVAATFLRGIEVTQLPTTLLAQVDASIGGKTAIDLPEAKNSVGVFHHPAFVVADAAWLRTLPREEVRSGLVEALKMGILAAPLLFERIERDLPALLDGQAEALAPVVEAAARAKATIVEGDPGESGSRQLLNLGHTLGHALETALGYGGLRHGEAVGWGIVLAARLAERLGLLAAVDGERIRRLLGRFDLPVWPAALASGELLEVMGRDKKAVESGLRWVLPERIGGARHGVSVPADVVDEELSALAVAARSRLPAGELPHI